MVVSRNKEPQYRPLYIIAPIMRTPPKKDTPNFGEPQINTGISSFLYSVGLQSDVADQPDIVNLEEVPHSLRVQVPNHHILTQNLLLQLLLPNTQIPNYWILGPLGSIVNFKKHPPPPPQHCRGKSAKSTRRFFSRIALEAQLPIYWV